MNGNAIYHNATFNLPVAFLKDESFHYVQYLFDGVLGLGINSNSELDQYSVLKALIWEGIIGYENFFFPPMNFISSSNSFEGNITLGTDKFLIQEKSPDYYFQFIPKIPLLPQSEIMSNQLNHYYLFNLGMRDIEILNYFDTESWDMNETVVIDLGVQFLQLPTSTLNYFNDVFYDANCNMPNFPLI